MISLQNKTSALLVILVLAFVNTACAATPKRTQGQAACTDCQTTVAPNLEQTKKFSDQLSSLTSCGSAEKGMASFYGQKDGLVGKKTSSGEILTATKFTAAHRDLPFGTLVKVRSLTTNREVIVKVNDRGPARKDRMIDLNFAAAKAIGLDKLHLDEVEMQVCNPN